MTTDFAFETLDLAAATMTGQLRDLVLDHMRDVKQDLPWTLMPEQRQQELISKVELSVRNAVGAAVRILAKDGKAAVDAHVEQITVKDGIKVTLTLPKTPDNLLLVGPQVGSLVLITVADVNPYVGGQERHPEKLQQEMFDDGDDDKPIFDGTPSGRDD